MKGKRREREEACAICGHYHDVREAIGREPRLSTSRGAWPAFASLYDSPTVPLCAQYEGGEPCSVCGHRLAAPAGGGANPKAPSAFPTEVLPDFLFLGSYDHASRSELLKTLGIGNILNTVPTCQNLYKNSFTYHTASSSPPPLEECFEFLEGVRKQGGKVLVHCMSGTSRSPAVVIYYLMRHRGWRLSESYSWVRDRRPQVPVGRQAAGPPLVQPGSGGPFGSWPALGGVPAAPPAFSAQQPVFSFRGQHQGQFVFGQAAQQAGGGSQAGGALGGHRPFAAAAADALPADALLSLTPGVRAQLDRIAERHAQLLEHLGGDAMNQLSPAEMAKLNKELSDLEPVVEALEELQRRQQELEGLAALMDDPGEDEVMRRLAREERSALAEGLPALERALLLALLPRDSIDERGVILEVRAGTGGDEACLFAMDLFRMYERYAAGRGWKFETVEMADSDLGGAKLASAAIAGRGGVYGRLKFESGIHRVQRVPATESGGRVHTSAASVAVLPQAEDVDVHIRRGRSRQPVPTQGARLRLGRDEDLRIDVYRAGGAGGQHVNTTNSAVRVTHVPTGLAVAIQDERSQHKNKAKALKVLRARLFEAEQQRRRAAQSRERKEQIGSGDRSERIRTYNFSQARLLLNKLMHWFVEDHIGRVTDHRVGVTEHGLPAVLAGERLDVFIEALRVQHQTELLANLDKL
eukprot:scaffold9.g3068.t1